MAGQLNGSEIAASANEGGFGVDEIWFDSVVVVAVSGALDLLTAPALVDAINAATQKSPTGIIVDLAKVDFLASTGMNVLVATHRALSPTTRFAVVADSPMTSRPLKLLGLDTLLSMFPTLGAALQTLTEA
jgi:anti-sigma B factor antagonist